MIDKVGKEGYLSLLHFHIIQKIGDMKMAKLIDLTGQKFDKLTVLEKAESRARHVYWKCQCDCGNIVERSGEYLRRNIANRDCGCSLKKNIHKKKMQEKKGHLIGKRFGRLVVIERTDKSNNGGVIWRCKCDCGNEKEVPTSYLTSGHTKSCGCLKLESHLINISNQKFGRLTALYFIQNTGKWHCRCDCGNEKDIDSYLLKNGTTQSCGCINYSIGEFNIEKILKDNNIIFQSQYTENSLGRKKFDFAIFNNNDEVVRLIEFDGQQHYNSTQGYWNSKNPDKDLQHRQELDEEKNEWATIHNIPLVRIPYWERDNITLDMILGDKYLIN